MTIISRIRKTVIYFMIAVVVVMGVVFLRIHMIHQLLEHKENIEELHNSLSLLRCDRMNKPTVVFASADSMARLKGSLDAVQEGTPSNDYESSALIRLLGSSIEEMDYVRSISDEYQEKSSYRMHLERRYRRAESRIIHGLHALYIVTNAEAHKKQFRLIYLVMGILSAIIYFMLWYGLALLEEVGYSFKSLQRGIAEIQKGSLDRSYKDAHFEELTALYQTIYDLTKNLNDSYDEIYHMASFPQLDPNPILEIAPDARIVYANSAAKMMMNRYGETAFLPTDIKQVIDEIYDQITVNEMRREVVLGDMRFEISLYKPFDIDAIRIYAKDTTERFVSEKKFVNVTRMYQFLSRVNHAVAFASDSNELFELICKAAVEQGRFMAALYYHCEEQRESPCCSNVKAGIDRARLSLDIERYRDAHVCSSGVLKVFNSLGARTTDSRCGSMALIPIKCENAVTGEFILCADEENYFNRDEIELLDRITHDIGFALVSFKQEADRRVMQDELIKSESRYKSIFEKSKAAMLLINPEEGKIIDTNDAACAFYGYSKEILCTKTIFDLNAGEPEDMTREMSNALLEKRNHYIFEHRLADGSIRKVETYSGNVLVHDSVYLFSIIHDVTDKYKAEEQIRQLNATLERRINERTAELHAYAKELESFSYSVSHDLRAPLRSIAGFSKFLNEDFNDILNEQGKDYLKRIISGVEKMNGLIDNLLDLSRITRSELLIKPVDISLKVNEILKEFIIEDPERVYELDIEEGLYADADERLLSIALTNLLSNAWKYCSKKDRTMIIFKKIEMDSRDVFVIEDNGAGFDMRYADKLFGVFQRLHGGGEFAGTGIGLAIVQRIILRHGGKIWAEAEVEKGSRFYFTLSATSKELA